MVGARCGGWPSATKLCQSSIGGPVLVDPVSQMRPRQEVDLVLRLAGRGLSQAEIARRTGIPRGTLGGWLRGAVPLRHRDPIPGGRFCSSCGHRQHDAERLDEGAYSYLLGMYLGDGHIARFPRASCLRVTLDARYPGIIGECVRSIRTVVPTNAVSVIRCRPHRCVKVQVYSRQWPCLLPQHGSGRKHERSIVLAPWQRRITHASPEMLIRGLIHSDGCRFINRVRHGDKVYAYPRYSFSNRSREIHSIFAEHLALLGIEWRWSNGHTISVSRRPSVARLDAFVGPKR